MQFSERNSFIENMLQLKLKTFILNENCHGLPFLGFVLREKQIHLHMKSKRRFRLKLKKRMMELENGIITERCYSQSLLALYGFINHANRKKFSGDILSQLKVGNRRLEPCESRRKLEQQCEELPSVGSQQRHSRQSLRQFGPPPLPPVSINESGGTC